MGLFFGRSSSTSGGAYPPEVEPMPKHNPGDGLLTANMLFGGKVVNPRHQTLGTITELLLDASRGRIAYAVIATGGFMGVNEQFFAIPWTALAHDAENRRFVIDADRSTLAGAPHFERDSWQAVDARWHREIHDHYGAQPYWE